MKILKNKLISGSIIVITGTIIGGIISYLFATLMGRLLGPSKYGDFAAITSFIGLMTTIGSALSTVMMRYSGELFTVKKYSELYQLIRITSLFVLIISILLIIFGLLLSPLISQYFSISQEKALNLALLSIFFILLLVVYRGILQGVQRFTGLVATNIAEVTIKLLIGYLLIKIGMELYGAILALVVAPALTCLLGIVLIKDIKIKALKSGRKYYLDKNEVFNYTWPTLLSASFLYLIAVLDVFLVKRYFIPEVAGQYIAISTIAKIIFYITTPIGGVMFPLITEQRTKGEKHYKTLFVSFIVTMFISITFLIIYSEHSNKIVNMLYGAQYVEASRFLVLSAVLASLATLVTLMVNYFTSIKNFTFIIFLAVFISISIMMAGKYHQDVSTLIYYLLRNMSLLLITLVCYYIFTKRFQIIFWIKEKYD